MKLKIKDFFRNFKQSIPVHVKITALFYLTAIALYFIFRLILFFTQTDQLNDAGIGEILQAFLMGIRYDVVVSGYFLILPILVLTVFAFIGKKNRRMEKIVLAVLTVIFSLSFLVCGADIPYFNQFFDRFNVGAFTWMDGGIGFVFKMIFQEPSYWLYIIPVIGAGFIYYFIGNKIIKNTVTWEKGNYTSKIIYSVLSFALIVLGMRGRIDEKSPIRIGTAYFCDNAFLNQLGLNPNFTLIQSYLDSRSDTYQEYPFTDDDSAIRNVQNYLNIANNRADYPLAREIVYDSLQNNYNVVLIIMESMGADKMGRYGNAHNLTPFLDSLAQEGTVFDNCYTAGTHTYNGIYSTLFSYPCIFRRHPMKQTPILTYNGIANILKKHHYTTTFFLTHDKEFDNINGFLRANDFDKIVSKSDYPAREVKTTLGVPDDYMFRYSIPVLNELSRQNQPFFATFLTASDHGPFYLPDYFNPKSDNIKEQMVEYADYSLQQFMKSAKQQPWFDNTIFVFVADHGYVNNAIYPLPESYIHSPLIFFCPKLLSDSSVQKIAAQIDIFPTLMGLLNISYTNNTFGIDLFRENRPYTVATGDDKFAVLDTEWLLIVNYNDSNPSKLFKYKNKDRKDYSKEQPEKVKEMRAYGESNLQACQYILRTRKQKTE